MTHRFVTFIFIILMPPCAWADQVVPNRTIRAGQLITQDVLRVIPGDHEKGFTRIEDVLGQEARTSLYPNRPIFSDQLGPPALVQRNQIVQMRFAGRRLLISTEGRALERGAVGDRVKIMNLSSKATLFGYVQPDGHVAVYQ